MQCRNALKAFRRAAALRGRGTSALAETAATPEPSAEALQQWRRYKELSRTEGSARYREVNRRYRPPLQPKGLPVTSAADNARGRMSEKHLKDSWSDAEIADAVRDNVVMTWTSSASRYGLPQLVRGEGVYVYDSNGKEYMDMTSQAVCMNMGYTVDPAVRNAVMKQMDQLAYAYPGLGMTEVRARLCNLMAEITPGDINGFLFPLGGSEANEGAIRMARRYTGKFKVMSAMRSYHGGTMGPLAATGDFRAKFAGEQAGFVKIYQPHTLRFCLGASDEEAAQKCLMMLEERILGEGPDTIAAILLETIVGANGVFLNPSGYLEGVRALCDKYDILLILDEVMCGFWRTGPLFAFQHFKGVVPDILTSAKGLTSSLLPLGMIGMRQKIMDFFENEPLGWGATYANHPVSLACAYEVVRKNCAEGMEEKVARIEEVMLREMDRLIRKHRSVSQGRVVGAFGCLDLVNADGDPLNMLGQPLPREALVVKKSMVDRGLIGLFRRIDGVLDDLDAALDN